MPYKPNEFSDIPGDAKMAPSELRPPLNFADGGLVNWAGDSTVYNTQSQIGNVMATPGGFGSMASQFTSSAPFSQDQNPFSGYQDESQTQGQSDGTDFNLGTILQPMPPVPPPPNPTVGSFSSDAYNSVSPPLSGGNTTLDTMPEAGMAKGGNVSNLINRLKGEFSKRGLDFDRVMAHRLAQKGQGGDTMLAHINSDEANMLKKAGGSGTLNPHTGLHEFYRSGGDSAWGGGSSSDSTSARAGDTPGFGSGGGGSVGGGGGYGSTSGGISGGGSGGSSGGGGGGRDDSDRANAAARQQAERAQAEREKAAADAAAAKAAAANAARIQAERATYEAQQRAAQEAAANAARIQAEKAAYEKQQAEGAARAEAIRQANIQKTADEAAAAARKSISNINIGSKQANIIPASRGLPMGPTDAEMEKINEQINAAKAAGTYISGTGGFGGKALPSSMQNVGPNVGYEAPIEGEFETQPTNVSTQAQKQSDLAEKQAQAAINAANARMGFSTVGSTPSAPPTSQTSPTPQEKGLSGFEKALASTISSSVKASIPPQEKGLSGFESALTPQTRTINPLSAAALRAVQDKSMSDLAAAIASGSSTKTINDMISGEQPAVTAPVTNAPVTNVAVTNPSVTNPSVNTAPITAPVQKNIFDTISDINAKRIAELEQAGEFAGGSKTDVAAALGVDPSELQSRIVNYDGRQKVDYFTKGLDQALAEMVTGPFQAISNLFGSNVNQTPRGSYVRDPRFSDLFSQNVPSKGYGPYGDLTLDEYNKQYGGKDAAGAGAPVTNPTVPTTPTPTPTPEPKNPLTEWSRKRTGLPFDPFAYGYGGEYTYYSAKGGPVSPLSKIRK